MDKITVRHVCPTCGRGEASHSVVLEVCTFHPVFLLSCDFYVKHVPFKVSFKTYSSVNTFYLIPYLGTERGTGLST